jgi:hypothetical protein
MIFSPSFHLCSTCVATELGRGSSHGARKAARIGQSLALTVGVLMMVLLLIVHNWWPLLFISGRERELLALSSSLMVAARFMAITDSVQNNCGGKASVLLLAAKNGHTIGRLKIRLCGRFLIEISLDLIMTRASEQSILSGFLTIRQQKIQLLSLQIFAFDACCYRCC